jgi:hypothetical protein
MERNSLSRPPRSKRPAEVIRHVDETMDAHKRMVEAARKDKPVEPPPGKPAGG